MRVSSERSSHAASIRYLVKIAWRTIPRCGLVALIFLLSGLYMLFDTCGAWRELWAQQHIPVEIIASVIGEAVTLEELRQIEGIERVSPIRCLDAQLISGKHALTCKVLAVLPDYPSFPIIQGGMFPAKSNMPYMIGNEALLALGFSCGETLTIRSEAGERMAMLCGIFQDGSSEPSVYMSFETAAAAFPYAEDRELILTLSGTGAWETAVSQLRKCDVYPEGETGMEPDWEPFSSRTWISITLLCCAAALLRERRRLELVTHIDELQALRSLGLQAVYPLRLLMTLVLCATCAALAYEVF